MSCHAQAFLRVGRPGGTPPPPRGGGWVGAPLQVSPGDVESAFGLLHLMRMGHGSALPLLTNGACTRLSRGPPGRVNLFVKALLQPGML
jgi:hypothetical protein